MMLLSNATRKEPERTETRTIQVLRFVSCGLESACFFCSLCPASVSEGEVLEGFWPSSVEAVMLIDCSSASRRDTVLGRDSMRIREGGNER